jgi:hypothetical protein
MPSPPSSLERLPVCIGCVYMVLICTGDSCTVVLKFLKLFVMFGLRFISESALIHSESVTCRLQSESNYIGFGISSGIVACSTRTGYLVCTCMYHYIPVHTGMYLVWYGLVHTRTYLVCTRINSCMFVTVWGTDLVLEHHSIHVMHTPCVSFPTVIRHKTASSETF